ncbi:hypothetical protein C8A01DRAFT_49582 [Parachaetomium inaequale]|uniref:Uncharacterized protein n=1 Tax=Parachaetomium inaequale TaxID=2588326 RepID=A0AAN6P8W2_9PEZI|nr:hypothetical protein C8A01DRAFT_49582 [Parachaetomium inaequale]
MESPAPKRRRTSPRNAVPVQPEPQSTTPRDAPPRAGSSPSRPSFASPTRASLERHNPDILRRRESQPRRLRSSPDAPPSASRAATPDSTGSLTRAMRTQLELRSGAHDGARAVSEGDRVLRSPARRLGPAGTPTRPTPRPLPPPAPEEDDELLKAISARLQPGVYPGVLPEVVAPEPELPPTPEHPDPVVSTPPSGIHNTPSRRAKRNRALAERLRISSPLKQPPLRPPELPKKGGLEFGLPAKKGQTQTAVPADPAPTDAEIRGLKPADPDSDKKKLRASLLAEISQLERDLDIASHENERIRQARLSRHDPSPPTNAAEILDLLTRHALPPDANPPKPDPIQDWLASALNPIAFLPFSKPALPPPTQPHPAEGEEEEDLPPPTSHHPLPMSATEALPYLQVFTPLTFTSHVSPLPRDGENTGKEGPLLQQHSITASSPPPRSGLFTARIDMTVNTKTMAIAALAVPRLDPAAEAELRSFVDRIVKRGVEEKEPVSSGLYNNVGVLAWAMGEWLRVAVQRAKVWSVLQGEVGDKDGLREMVARQRARRKRARRGRRRREEEEEDGSDGEEDGSVDGTGKYETADLLPFMGRTCMDLEVPVLEGGNGEVSMLRVQWRIGFDWTGEARSEMGVLVGVPGKWHKHDKRGQLSGLPKLFDELVQGGEEPLAAVRTVVCLLAGEQRT